MNELLYEDGRRYDALYGTEGPDVEFFVALGRAHGGPILELACGTGKYLLAWAKAGLACAGLDSSAEMLRWADAKARLAVAAPSLTQGDMRAFNLEQRFCMIVIAGNSVCHLLTHADLRRMLACVRRHLTVDGVFVIDVFVPDVRLLARDPDLHYPFGTYLDPDSGERVDVTCTQRYDPSTQISHIVTQQRRAAHERPLQGSLTLKMWYPCELEAALVGAGFTIRERFGGHDRSPFGANSGKQILVCAADEAAGSRK